MNHFLTLGTQAPAVSNARELFPGSASPAGIQADVNTEINRAINAVIATIAAAFPHLNPAPVSPAPTTGDCGTAAFGRDIHPDLDAVSHCNGEWVRIGKDRADWVLYAYWDGNSWQTYPSDGTTTAGMMQACHGHNRARPDGAPEDIVRMMPTCG